MTNQANNQSVKLPVVSTILGPLALTFSGGFGALLLCLAFSLIITAIMGTTGNLTSCIAETFRTKYYCTNNLLWFFAARILVFAVNVIFIRNWVNILDGQKLNWRQVFVPTMRDVKTGGIILGFLATLGVALFSLYLLYIRQPNPNWRIEIIYFGIVSLGFLVPILALRFLGYVTMAALGESLTSFKIIWQKTTGNMFVILSSAFVIFIIMMIILINFLQFAHNAASISNLGQAWLTEFICSFAKIVSLILFSNFCYVLNKNLSERK